MSRAAVTVSMLRGRRACCS